MQRNTIAVIWAAGIVLAAVVYLIGPDRFVYAMFDLVQRGWWGLQEALRNISIAAFDLVRALAIGLYFVFLALALLSVHRGNRGRAAIIAVSLVFFGLIWHSAGEGFGAHTRWMAALLLAAVGALSMTRRLSQPEPSAWRPGAMPPRPGPP
jgi:hypothetical protein